MSVANIRPLPHRRFIDDADLAEQAKRTPTSGQFEAAGLQFDFKIIGWFDVAETLKDMLAKNQMPDRQHVGALQAGYAFCYRLVAAAPDGCVYAVWEVYSDAVGSLSNSKSRTIEVDADWTGRGIGSAFVKTVRKLHPIAWSGHFTPAGVKLKERVEAAEEKHV